MADEYPPPMNTFLKPPLGVTAYTLHKIQKASKTKNTSSEDAASGSTLEDKGELLAVRRSLHGLTG